MAKREDVMRKVAALLAKAAGTTFEAERATFLAKADQLMTAHAIEEFELAQARPATDREHPELRWITLYDFSLPFDVRWDLERMFRSLVDLVGAKVATKKYTASHTYEAHVVGYRMDLDYLESLYINLQMHFLRTVTPRKDEALSDLDNFINLREAGKDWESIFKIMGWEWKHNGKEVVGSTRTKLHQMRNGYTSWCKAQGKTPVKGKLGSTYFNSFLAGYTSTIQRRVAEMGHSRDEAGFGLVLAGRGDDLNEALWNAYPDQRPHPAECECDTCHVQKCRDPKCQRAMCKERRKPVKMGRVRTYKEPKEDARAWSLGANAAKSADLGGSKVASRRERLS